MPVTRIRPPTRRSGASTKGDKLERSFREQLMKVIYERTAKCPSCRYSLNGIVGTRCPECGLVVEEYLRVADTMPRRWKLLKRQQNRAAMVWGGCVLVVLIAVFVYVVAIWR